MNLLLLEPSELRADGTAELSGRRLVHLRDVLKAAQGDTLRVGVVGGRVGSGELLSETTLRVTLTDEPPPRPGLDLVLAMPRPKALKRVLQAAASLGVGRIALVNAARVEKSFWQSPVLAEAREQLLLGLEQARDTVLPELIVRERFKPFVEDELDAWCGARRRLVAHPGGARMQPGPAVLAIGPEGGWVPFELQCLQAQRFEHVTLGPRILRVEVAVPFALGGLVLRP